MPGEAGRTISTCAIWAATACVLIFSGLYRTGGDAQADWVMLGCTALVALAAAAATITVWLAHGKRAAGGEAVHLAANTQREGTGSENKP